MATKPKFERADLGVNPFSQDVSILVRKEEMKHQYKKVDTEFLPVVKEMEVTEFVRFYTSSERRLIRNKLSLRSKEMLLWIMDELEYNKEYIWINKDRYMKELEIKSINTYKEALHELIRYVFIHYTVKKDVYWINPDFMFKGNRVLVFPNNVVVK